MPAGVNVEVDGGYARISFPDASKKGPGLHALLRTGAPIDVRTGGRFKVYIVPEGNAREAGLLDAPPVAQEKKSPPAPAKKAPAKKAPAKKAPAKKVEPEKKEADDGTSNAGD